MGDQADPLHALIEAETEDQAHRAERRVREVLNDPSKLPTPVNTQLAVRQSIFGSRGPRGGHPHQRSSFAGNAPFSEGNPSFSGNAPSIDHIKEMRVTGDVAAGIIGRGGETVKRLQMESGAKISIARDVDPQGLRVVTFRSDNPDTLASAFSLVENFIRERANMAAAHGGGGGPSLMQRQPPPSLYKQTPPSSYKQSSSYNVPPPSSYNNAPPSSYNNAPSSSYNNAPPSSYNNAPYNNAPPASSYHNAPSPSYKNVPHSSSYNNASLSSSYNHPPPLSSYNPPSRSSDFHHSSAAASAPMPYHQKQSQRSREPLTSYAPPMDIPSLGHPDSGAFVSQTFLIPNGRAGAIIGRNGTTIKSIQQKFHARISVPSMADPNNPEFRSVNVTADSMETIETIRAEINSIVEGTAAVVGNQDDGSVTFPIPDDKAGLVIGKMGSTIKGIQDRTGVRIQIPAMADPGSAPPTRMASILGRPEMVQAAIREIESILHSNVFNPAMASSGGGGGDGGGQQSTGGADYRSQWEEYYRQLELLPPDQKQKAIDALKEHQRAYNM